jgi:hypothetical protein
VSMNSDLFTVFPSNEHLWSGPCLTSLVAR